MLLFLVPSLICKLFLILIHLSVNHLLLSCIILVVLLMTDIVLHNSLVLRVVLCILLLTQHLLVVLVSQMIISSVHPVRMLIITYFLDFHIIILILSIVHWLVVDTFNLFLFLNNRQYLFYFLIIINRINFILFVFYLMIFNI